MSQVSSEIVVIDAAGSILRGNMASVDQSGYAVRCGAVPTAGRRLMTDSNIQRARIRENTPWLGHFQRLLEPGVHVLDLGCGTGDDTIDLITYGCTVIALDADVRRIRQVPKRTASKRVVADITGGLPFTNNSFGLVVSSLSLHYFSENETERAVRDIARVLKEDSWLVCRVNAIGDVNFGYGQGKEVEHSVFRQPEGHLKRFFDETMIRRFLEPCFRLDQITPRTILQRGVPKQTLECLGQKR